MKIDIAIFIIAVIIAQIISYYIMNLPQMPRIVTFIASKLLMILLLAFIVFTFYPPKTPIFMDSTTGEYGIPTLLNLDSL